MNSKPDFIPTRSTWAVINLMTQMNTSSCRSDAPIFIFVSMVYLCQFLVPSVDDTKRINVGYFHLFLSNINLQLRKSTRTIIHIYFLSWFITSIMLSRWFLATTFLSFSKFQPFTFLTLLKQNGIKPWASHVCMEGIWKLGRAWIHHLRSKTC